MTSPRDVFLKALGREKAERPATGSATSVVTADLMQETGIHFPEAHHDPRKMAALAAAGHTVLGFDNVMPLFSVWHESSAMGCAVDWGHDLQMPNCRQSLFKIGDEITIPGDLLDRPGCKAALEAIAILKKEYGDEVAIVGKVFGPWTLGYHMFGVEQFLINTILDPDYIRKAMETLKELTVLFGRAQVEAGADALCLGDHATRDLCSPEAYSTFLAPIHAELVERIPCPLILHICGDTSDRIEFIRETGVACFHFDSKVPATKARALASERLALMGGTSNFTQIQIREGTQESIRADVREKVATGIDIIGPECAVPLDAPYRNMRVLTEQVKGCAR
ncbi:MAG: uroporphyrinogen decarboxylase family protein [Planctomycetota bacterium]|jgi:[methyl-Co(III) methanol-specific corrinoid protein]:coenzyme M methyltransferase